MIWTAFFSSDNYLLLTVISYTLVNEFPFCTAIGKPLLYGVLTSYVLIANNGAATAVSMDMN